MLQLEVSGGRTDVTRVAVFADAPLLDADGLCAPMRALMDGSPGDLRPRLYVPGTAPAISRWPHAVRSASARLPGIGRAAPWPDVPSLVADARADGVAMVHAASAGPMGLAAAIVAFRPGVPLVGSCHFGIAGRVLGRRGLRIGPAVEVRYRRWFYGRCERVFAASAAMAARLMADGLGSDRVELWPRAIDAERFRPDRRSQEIRSRWGASEARPAVLCAVPAATPGVQAFLLSLTRLLGEHGVQHRLVIAGQRPTRGLGANSADDWVFLGSIAEADRPAVTASADICLAPAGQQNDTGSRFAKIVKRLPVSFFPGAGQVALEAMASGLPVIAVEDTDAAELVRPGVTGFLCAPGDLFDVAWRATMLLRDRQRRLAFGDAGRRAAMARTPAAAIDDVFRVWREVVSRAGSSRGSHRQRRSGHEPRRNFLASG
jgi:phosphatidylinositol alpha 1,6-mannosyltransferase